MRRKYDNYVTPPEVAEKIVDWLRAHRSISGNVYEPACGDTAPFVSAIFDRSCGEWCQFQVSDIRPVIDGQWTFDFLEHYHEHKYDLIITNPPYSLAERFVRRAISLLIPGGLVVFLLRLNFLASQGRKELFREYPPSHVLVLCKRPSFTGDGKTDGQEYAFFVWEESFKGRTEVQWL